MVKPEDLVVGKTYVFDHSRKGRFVGRVESVGDVWADVKVVAGRANAALDYNVRDVGQVVTIRIEFLITAMSAEDRMKETL